MVQVYAGKQRATQAPHLFAIAEEAFADMLRLLHGKEAVNQTPTLDFLATLAVLADRFDCAPAVSKSMSAGGLKLKWPVTQRKVAVNEDPRMSRSLENALRQKILVAWLLKISC